MSNSILEHTNLLGTSHAQVRGAAESDLAHPAGPSFLGAENKEIDGHFSNCLSDRDVKSSMIGRIEGTNSESVLRFGEITNILTVPRVKQK
ncbi:MAG: hypothetical protein HC810_03820 [Acaryochloridaceae cyanobacterium RL_2_7]|nr:hypothetical protein [Acaryochloridaceae cyanobacterium RL_2_7]